MSQRCAEHLGNCIASFRSGSPSIYLCSLWNVFGEMHARWVVRKTGYLFVMGWWVPLSIGVYAGISLETETTCCSLIMKYCTPSGLLWTWIVLMGSIIDGHERLVRAAVFHFSFDFLQCHLTIVFYFSFCIMLRFTVVKFSRRKTFRNSARHFQVKAKTLVLSTAAEWFINSTMYSLPDKSYHVFWNLKPFDDWERR